MKTPARLAALILIPAAILAGPLPAEENPALLKDLTSVILLLGLPCDKVVSAKRLVAGDHLASCGNGNRFRVFVNPEGRVIAEQQ